MWRGRSAAVKVSLSALDLLELLEGAARVALLRGADRLVLGADLLLLGADLLLLGADLLLLQAPALGVVPGATILVLGALRAVLDALDGLPDTLLFAPALGRGAPWHAENETETDHDEDRQPKKNVRHVISLSDWVCVHGL
jgi:hypothetical protein